MATHHLCRFRPLSCHLVVQWERRPFCRIFHSTGRDAALYVNTELSWRIPSHTSDVQCKEKKIVQGQVKRSVRLKEKICKDRVRTALLKVRLIDSETCIQGSVPTLELVTVQVIPAKSGLSFIQYKRLQ